MSSGAPAHHRRRSRPAQAPCGLPLDELIHRCGASGPTLRQRAGGAHETRLLEFTPEVRRLVADTADRLEHTSRLRHREALRQQPHRDIRPPELAAQARDTIVNDARVVEPEWWKLIDGLPSRTRLVRAEHSRVDQREIRDGRNPTPRVALRV